MEALAIQRTLQSSTCPRCKQNIDVAHDGERKTFCPAFAQPSEVGEWIATGRLLRALAQSLRRHRRPPILIDGSSRIQDPWNGAWHISIGSTYESQFFLRLDTPAMPEFSLFAPYRGSHSVIYRGWRSYLTRACKKTRIPWSEVAARLGVSPDKSTEETRRTEAGWY